MFLNAGDHKHMLESFSASLRKMGFKESDYEVTCYHHAIHIMLERKKKEQLA